METMPEIIIGPRRVSRDGPPLVIAEIGVNHDGDMNTARELVRAAHQALPGQTAGVCGGAVKFQLFTADRLLAREAGLVEYQKTSAQSAHELLSGLELSPPQMAELVQLAKSLGLAAIITPFSPDLVPVAQACGADALKLASPDLVNRPLIEAALATGLPLILSTGAARLEEISQALRWVDKSSAGGASLGGGSRGVSGVGSAGGSGGGAQVPARQRVILLHCVSSYPTPENDASLAGIRVLRLAWDDLPIGYSDHTMLTLTGGLAVAAGACVLEKHLTLDKTRPGPDHAASLEPADLAEYVRLADRAYRMCGPMEKRVLPIELEIRAQTRQSIAAAVDLAPGTILTLAHLTVKRPGTGLPAAGLRDLVGRKMTKPVAAGSLLKLNDLGDPES